MWDSGGKTVISLEFTVDVDLSEMSVLGFVLH